MTQTADSRIGPGDDPGEHTVRDAQRTVTHAAFAVATNVWMLGLLTYLVVFPAGLLKFLAPLLAVSGTLGLVRMRFAGNGIRSSVRLTIVWFALAGCVPVALGLIASTPGWKDVSVPLVGGPLLWYLLGYLPDRRAVQRIPTALAIGTGIVSVVMLMLVSKIGDGAVRALTPKAYGFVSDGSARVSFVGISSLIATVPFLATISFDSLRLQRRLRHRNVILAALAVGLFAAAISGRQGVIGAVVLTPALMMFTSAIGFRPARQTSTPSLPTQALVAIMAVVVIGLVGGAALGADLGRLPRGLLGSIGLVDDSGNALVEKSSEVRSLQSASFVEGFLDSPLIGHGGGAVSPDVFTWRGYESGAVFKDTPRPWRAELSYHLLLFEAGLAGVAAYTCATVIGVRTLRRRYSVLDDGDRLMIRASVVASIALAIASAFNPIPRAVGHQWAFFLPVIIAAAVAAPRQHHDTTATDAATTGADADS